MDLDLSNRLAKFKLVPTEVHNGNNMGSLFTGLVVANLGVCALRSQHLH